MNHQTIESATEKAKHIYIDEFGNNGFDFEKQGVSTHFILTSIIVNPEDVDEISQSSEEIREGLHLKDELKFSSFKKKFHNQQIFNEKLLGICNTLKRLNLQIICFVFDKRKIFEDSPIRNYKKTFYKFLNSKLYDELWSRFQSLRIEADEHGSRDFMDEFKNYFHKKSGISQDDLFCPYEFRFRNSIDSPLVQLADFVAGLFSIGFDEKAKLDIYESCFALIEEKVITIEEWPYSYEKLIDKKVNLLNSSEINRTISVGSIRKCRNYISDNIESNEEYCVERMIVLKRLLWEFRNNIKAKYLTSSDLIECIAEQTGKRFTKHEFMHYIIGHLRDSEVIISSSEQGYKIPTNEADIYSYVNRSFSNIDPMMNRLKVCRKEILKLTGGELDILSQEKFDNIRRYLNL